MRRFHGVVAALILVALPAYAAAQAAPAKAAPAGKAATVTGTVSAVAADSLTVKVKAEDTVFAIDAKTKVIGAGASHKTAENKAQDKPTVITDFVKVGDNVSVTYHEAGGTKTAKNVRVRMSKPAK